MYEDRILAILARLHPEFDYATSTDFIGDGLLDSFDIVMLVSELEGEFSVRIPGEQIRADNFTSAGAIARLLAGRT